MHHRQHDSFLACYSNEYGKSVNYNLMSENFSLIYIKNLTLQNNIPSVNSLSLSPKKALTQ